MQLALTRYLRAKKLQLFLDHMTQLADYIKLGSTINCVIHRRYSEITFLKNHKHSSGGNKRWQANG